jgi:arylsulfatase A
MRRSFCWSLLIYILLLPIVGAGAARTGKAAAAPGSERSRKPNVVLIMADDLGAECLGSYGGTSYKTPHLDELARTGIRFQNCYATPLCSPSRVQLMTGRYGFRTGWTRLIDVGPGEYLDPKREKTFGHMLRDAGYATALAGKWQLCQFDQQPDNVRDCGFDEYCCWAWVYKGQKTSRYWNPVVWQNGKAREDVADRYGPDVYCDFLIDFMKRNRSRPFFAYYPMALVHNPLTPTPDSKGGGGRMRRRNAAHFPAMIAYMDKLVGRIAASLDDLGLRENTLILFTGDNGTIRGIVSQVGDTTITGGKGTVTEAGARVPLIGNWKGMAPSGRVCEDLVDFSDFMPTLAEITGARLPHGVTIDGRSFAPQLRGQPGKPREWVFTQLGRNRFVRERGWKLYGDGRLFDMRNGSYEGQEVSPASSEEAAAAGKRLQAVLDRLR